jgi:cytoskeletal protein RodZ
MHRMVEPMEQIGTKLRSAREAAGLSLDDVVFRTRLPKSILTGLEAEDFSVFASPVYAKSFLSQYSEFLNVDARDWLDALEPGAFSPGGSLHPLLDAPEPHLAPEPAVPTAGGGWFAVIGLFTLSVALVYGVMESFAFFEAKFEKAPVVSETPQPTAVQPVATTIAPKPAVQTEDEEQGNPPPRAIIVR